MTLFTVDRLTGELTGFCLGENASASHRSACIMAGTLSILSHEKAHLRDPDHTVFLYVYQLFPSETVGLSYLSYILFNT